MGEQARYSANAFCTRRNALPMYRVNRVMSCGVHHRYLTEP
jgi:hypothetical protein